MRIASRPLSAETIAISYSSSTVDRAKMLRMSSSTISTRLPARILSDWCSSMSSLPLGLGQLGDVAVQEEDAQVEQAVGRVGAADRAGAASRFQARLAGALAVAVDDHRQAVEFAVARRLAPSACARQVRRLRVEDHAIDPALPEHLEGGVAVGDGR